MSSVQELVNLKKKAKRRRRTGGDTSYQAVDTDDDCFSNNSAEFNSNECLSSGHGPAVHRAAKSDSITGDGREAASTAGRHDEAETAAFAAAAGLPDASSTVEVDEDADADDRQRGGDELQQLTDAARSLNPTARLIEALETLRDSINDNTSVALQQTRTRNRRRGTSSGQVNYKSSALKSDERCRIRSEKVVVEIRVVFLKIGEIDTLKELYHADAFIQAKWKEPLLEGRSPEELKTVDLEKYWNPLIYIDNILNETKEATWVVGQHDPLSSDVYIVERRRIKGVFLETLELNDFPLDVQDLTITITSERPDTEIELIPDEAEMSGINIQTFVDQQEWRLHEHIEVEKRTLTQEFSSTMKSHPCLAVRCRAARRPGYFYWNVFLIMFFITGLSFATFAVGADKPESRLQLSFTLFLTSVAFKFVINQSLPKISYLTYMFMISGLSFATFAVEPNKCEYRLRLSFTLVLTSVTF
uniref:Neur_chan_LBD domain-containing protein n=1 Tax=Macrostomum lignano TaxID=282301 RepID=A0A1I8GSY0_9PLAT